jgi:hypothetical protein
LVVVAVFIAAATACPTPAQEGGLKGVDNAGLIDRLWILCRSGHADPSCPAAADAAPTTDSGSAAENEAAAPATD